MSIFGGMLAKASREKRLRSELAAAQGRMQQCRVTLARTSALDSKALGAARDAIVRTACHISHIKRELQELNK